MLMSCRLLYVIGQLRPGGSERQLCSLLEGIDRQRYRPEVVVWNSREKDTYVPWIRALGVPLYIIPAVWRVAKLRHFRRLVKQLEPEVVHSYSFHTNFGAWWATLGTKAIPVGAVRGDFTRAKEKTGVWLGRLSARWPRSQISNSFSATDNTQHSRSFFVPGHLFVVRNGIDLERFRTTPLPSAGGSQIIGLGSLIPLKRWDRLLMAALQLKQTGFDFLVRIVGDGPLRADLESRLQERGIAHRTVLTGLRTDVQNLIAAMHVFVLSSLWEGLPRVLPQAMAAGRPIVCTRTEGSAEAVEDGKNGFLVEPMQPEAMAAKVEFLLKDGELRQRMGGEGRRRASEFSATTMVDAIDTLYRQLLLDTVLDSEEPSSSS